jgi:hypothetical protein
MRPPDDRRRGKALLWRKSVEMRAFASDKFRRFGFELGDLGFQTGPDGASGVVTLGLGRDGDHRTGNNGRASGSQLKRSSRVAEPQNTHNL